MGGCQHSYRQPETGLQEIEFNAYLHKNKSHTEADTLVRLLLMVRQTQAIANLHLLNLHVAY